MRNHRPKRRRSPQWVRDLDQDVLHALTWGLSRQRMESDLSERQEWLWDACISELTYRAARAAWTDLCRCHLCSTTEDAIPDRPMEDEDRR